MPRKTPLTPIFDYKRRSGSVVVGNTPGTTPIVEATTLAYVSNLVDGDRLRTARGITMLSSHAVVAGPFADILLNNSNVGGITIVDVSTPATMAAVETLQLNEAWDVARLGTDYVVVTRRNQDAVSIVDITDPTNISTVGTVTDATVLNWAFGVKVSGTTAFVTASVANRLVAVDCSTPASPTITGSVTNATTLSGASDLDISGSYAYVGCSGSSRLTVVDISNPASMSVVGSVQDFITLDLIEGVAFKDGYALCGGDSNETLTVVDCTTPSSPTVSTTVATGLGGAAGVDVVGDLCFVTGGQFGTGIAVFDVSDASSPTLIDSVAPAQITSSYGVAYVGDASGGYVYTTSYGANSIQVCSFT